jgi:hypothetical protein
LKSTFLSKARVKAGTLNLILRKDNPETRKNW